MTRPHDTRQTWASNGRSRETPLHPVSVRESLVLGARDVTRSLLRGQTIEGVSPRQLREWKERGGALAGMVLWAHARPQDVELVVAHVRGASIQSTAPFAETVIAQQHDDASEESAETIALVEFSADALMAWALKLEIQAASSLKAARAAREMAATLA